MRKEQGPVGVLQFCELGQNSPRTLPSEFAWAALPQGEVSVRVPRESLNRPETTEFCIQADRVREHVGEGSFARFQLSMALSASCLGFRVLVRLGPHTWT